MHSGWLLTRLDPIALSGRSTIMVSPTGFRTKTTIPTRFLLSCSLTSLRRKTALTATGPGGYRSLGRCVEACRKVLGWGPDRPARYRRGPIFLRSGFQPLDPPDLGSDRESRSQSFDHKEIVLYTIRRYVRERWDWKWKSER